MSSSLSTCTDTSRCNSPIDVMAVIQRATAEAAALSSRQVTVSGSNVTQKTTIGQQSAGNFNCEVSKWQGNMPMMWLGRALWHLVIR